MSKVIHLSREEVMYTPGLFRALACTPVIWTGLLRDTLATKGLNTEYGAQVYDMRDPHGNWMFCNASNGREAHAIFYHELNGVPPLYPTDPDQEIAL